MIRRNVATRNASKSGFVKIAMEKRTQMSPLKRSPEPAERACCCETYAMERRKRWNMGASVAEIVYGAEETEETQK